MGSYYGMCFLDLVIKFRKEIHYLKIIWVLVRPEENRLSGNFRDKQKLYPKESENIIS
jgi:hypothetical protein